MSNPNYNNDPHSSNIICKYCGKAITFSKEIVGKNNKMKPLNLDLTPHFCLTRTEQGQSRDELQSPIPRFENATVDSNYINRSEIQASVYDRIIGNMEHFNSLYEQILIECGKTNKQMESNSELIKKILDHVSSQHPNGQPS